MVKPNVFKYDDYRAYLKDWYVLMKKSNSAFSYRAFSRWAGLKSPNHLQLVIKGKRNITKSTLPVFQKILKLKCREKRYFELLVNFNQSTTPESKASYLKEMSSYLKRYGETLKHNQYEYLVRWYFPVLRELVTTKDFKENPRLLAKRIGQGITPRQVREAIDKLKELELLKYDKNKRLIQAQSVLSTGPESFESAVYFYHDQMLQMARDALHKQPPEERYFAGMTFACKKEDVSEIAQIINDFRAQIISYLDGRGAKNDDEEVYQLGIQLHRLTTPKG
ncbi:MAG: TIGR02147 family protein [Pseudomonadota bacterium]